MKASSFSVVWVFVFLHAAMALEAQSIAQLYAAQAFHRMKNSPEKVEAVGRLKENNWFVVDTFILLDNTMEFQKTDLAPFIDDNGSVVFLVAEASPEYPGGDVAMQKVFSDLLGNIVSGPQDEVHSTIAIKFLVNEDGRVTEVGTAQEHPEWISAARIETCLSAINTMPKWRPGLYEGKPVRVKMLATINLKE